MSMPPSAEEIRSPIDDSVFYTVQTFGPPPIDLAPRYFSFASAMLAAKLCSESWRKTSARILSNDKYGEHVVAVCVVNSDPKIHPTADQIRSTRESAGQHQGEAAATVYVGLRTWNRWEAGQASMHPAIWELYLIKTRSLLSESERECGLDA